MRFEANKDIYYSNCSGVFQGGGCKAIAYIGAYEVACEHGIMFSELAGTSAGSIFAAAIALGATPKQLKEFVLNLDFMSLAKAPERCYPKFDVKSIISIPFPKWIQRLFWKWGYPKLEKSIAAFKEKSDKPLYREFELTKFLNEYGIFDSSVLAGILKDWFSDISGIPDPKFRNLGVKLRVPVSDVREHSMKVFNNEDTPNDSIAEAVAASCSIPVVFTPYSERYVDGGLLSNRPDILIVNKIPYFRKLSFSLKGDDSTIDNVKDYLNAVMTTVLEGADQIQHQGDAKAIPNRISINCEGVSATDFHRMTPGIIQSLINKGRTAMEDFFIRPLDNENEDFSPFVHLFKETQMFSQIAYWSLEAYDEIVVVCQDLGWVWTLFPTVVEWCRNSVRLRVYHSNNNTARFKRSFINKLERKGKTHEQAEKRFLAFLAKEEAIRRFLSAIGAELTKRDKNMPEGFYFKRGDSAKAIIYDTGSGNFKGKIYHDPLDSYAVTRMMPNPARSGLSPVSIIPGKEAEVITALRKMPIYANAAFEWALVSPAQLRFLNRSIRGDKYKQISHMFNLYPDGMVPFSAISIVLKNGKESLSGPIVVEEHDGRLYVIEGNSRAVFAYRHGLGRLKVLIVRNVSTPLPLDMQHRPTGFSVEEVRIDEDSPEGKDRYKGFDYSLFRPIEQSLRPDAEYLI